ncbi:MAG: Stp1/IreP family PP2C-type Ser/Thr phosphatase [Eubacteriales bacterium]|nr:Stp1/IreP family PP2C-type Ser/Thr phosphatase [Eubacteriales bacterium]
MKAYVRTDIGKSRPVNQDAYYLPAQGERFAAVADGMGGHRAGEVASQIAVTEFSRWLRWAAKPDEDALSHAVAEANHAIYMEAKRDPLKAGMGTTLTAIWMDESDVYLAHLGDSRAYLYRKGALIQLSRDHSLVGEMLEKGVITYKESLTHPQRNYITRALGTGKNVEPDILRLDFQPGDVWLLCTDGLSNNISTYEMAAILAKAEGWQEKLEEMVQLSLERGGKDNITALLVTGEEDR